MRQKAIKIVSVTSEDEKYKIYIYPDIDNKAFYRYVIKDMYSMEVDSNNNYLSIEQALNEAKIKLFWY